MLLDNDDDDDDDNDKTIYYTEQYNKNKNKYHLIGPKLDLRLHTCT